MWGVKVVTPPPAHHSPNAIAAPAATFHLSPLATHQSQTATNAAKAATKQVVRDMPVGAARITA
jgi:hypothetical protein